ncbi:sigma-54 interaction domain-containing protein [Roseateles toxinivorans]|uniref:Transcriptional regulator with PAS, ATPase and Fis domain n=1 Tax=Roseateles toxinivorans TaxID=270368 RepID=A0A4R6QAU1_9BURK|nr:sigma 54-interacting transcriptional regulator [Roseateles toxinivorans]TDP59748.1 transcriptional regulator with PAS, ATPase and Fis domain [Roseateles toxinivorans]
MTAPSSALPQDADGLLMLAAQSMFDVFARSAQGMMVVDRAHRIVWISEGYKRFLPGLGFEADSIIIGRRVEDVVPNTLMAQVIESGRPILVDLLSNQAGTFLVSRLPLRDEAGQVIGAIGLVLMDHPETTMQPLMAKFSRLQQELEDAHRQLAAQRRPKHTIASFIGTSPAALEVKRQARRVAQGASTVLLLGETGTGKELLAHAIHAASARASRPFVGVNIAAVPETLLEAEFFGVAPGAYTGADRKGREGKFKLADGGTLFLDEIGDMPLALQSKLLRVLQEQELEPLGSNQVIRVDVRVIAATSRDLVAMVAAGQFRADLYYRLNVVPIRLPTLRERAGDFEALAEALLDDIARRSAMAHRELSPEALALLAAQPWPGNIRELRNVLEQASMMSDELRLTPAHFAGALPRVPSIEQDPTPQPLAPVVTPSLPEAGQPPRPLPEQIATLERQAISAALAHTQGNKLAAARLLQISRAALYDKLALYGLISPA